MKIIMGLYYYYPYISGLSVYTQKLAELLVARGHKVTIVTSQYNKDLDREEYINEVLIKRIPVLVKLDKGAIMPEFVTTILYLGKNADIINLHLPMAEASLIAMMAPHKTVLNYICDPRLNSRGPIGQLFESMVYRSLNIAVQRAAATVAMSFDYAANSRVLSFYLKKVWVIPPPIEFVSSNTEPTIEANYFRHRAQIPKDAKTIGFLGRIVYEKGIDFLIHAFHDLQKKHDDLYLIIAGDYKDVAGGSVKSTLMHFLTGYEERIRFTGRLTDEEVDAFYRFIDVLALPSIDPLEAYGMVQVEAMLRGTPVVSTDLPGVRMIVQRTGMGKIVPRRDPHALATALHQVIYEKRFVTLTPEEIFHLLDLGNTVELYEDLFNKVRLRQLDTEDQGNLAQRAKL
jgi:glycosyltransferase involved in cell wall biosynthesis